MATFIDDIYKQAKALANQKTQFVIYIPANALTAATIKKHFPDIHPDTFILNPRTNTTLSGLSYITKPHLHNTEIVVIDNVLYLMPVSLEFNEAPNLKFWFCNYIESAAHADFMVSHELARQFIEQFYEWTSTTSTLTVPSDASANVIAEALSLVLLDEFARAHKYPKNPLLTLGPLAVMVRYVICGAIIEAMTQKNSYIGNPYYQKYGFHVDPIRYGIGMLQPGLRLSLEQPILSDQMIQGLSYNTTQITFFVAMARIYYNLDPPYRVIERVPTQSVTTMHIYNKQNQFQWEHLIHAYQQALNVLMNASERDGDIIITNLLALNIWQLFYTHGALMDSSRYFGRRVFNRIVFEFMLITDLRAFVASKLSNAGIGKLFLNNYFMGLGFNNELTHSEVELIRQLKSCDNYITGVLSQSRQIFKKLAEKKIELENTAKMTGGRQVSANTGGDPVKHLRRAF